VQLCIGDVFLLDDERSGSNPDGHWAISTGKSAWRQGSGQRRMPFPMPVSGDYASSASKSFRHSGITLAINTAFEVFTRAGPDDSLERLTERSVGLVTDRPSDVDELFVTLFE
jgi:hypothetical protein